ncbi:MAG: hypothetical protein HYX26_10530 [Acidobacteriales bacterium]|nr:hypothetical protein [Terriglobales bacterium]
MSRSRAVRTGFLSVLKRPEIFFAELMWRWAFTTAAAMVLAYAILGYLDTLLVSDRDLFGLANVVPGTVGPALANIFRGSGPRLVRIVSVALLGVALLWWVAASIGRLATLRAMLPGRLGRLVVVLRIHELRILVMVAAWLAYVAAFALAGAFSRTSAHAHDPGKFYLLFLPLVFVIGCVWSGLSWFLMLAPIFSVRDDRGVFASIGAAAECAKQRVSQFAWVGGLFGFLRLVAWVIGFIVLMTLLGIVAQAPAKLAWLVLLLWAMLYSAVANFLSIARLAAWVRIAEWDGTTAP